jgi:hypothetical protein
LYRERLFPTLEKLDDMLKSCIELVNDSPQVDCILTTSFSNSVVVETKEDSAILHYPTRECVKHNIT